MPARLKLTPADVLKLRRRVARGERLTDLAEEFGVDRKTIRRRLDALEFAERDEAERAASRTLRRQIARERRKLKEPEVPSTRPTDPAPGQRVASRPTARGRRGGDDYAAWLETRKNLSGRALSEAMGLVRMRSADGTIRGFVERHEVDSRLEDGWILED